jgi:hypothetical protein
MFLFCGHSYPYMRTDIAGPEDMHVTQAPLGSKEMQVGKDFSQVLH